MSDENRKATADPTRRTFLRGALVGTGAGLLQACGGSVDAPRGATGKEQPGAFDFTQSSPVLGADATVRSACQFCNANCGLDVHTRLGRVTSIEGVTEDPVQAGQLCVKADLMGQLVYNPRRLTQPLIRTGGEKGDLDPTQFREVSWDEALAHIATRFLSLRDEGEAHTIANRTTGRMLRGAGSVVDRFFRAVGESKRHRCGTGLQ